MNKPIITIKVTPHDGADVTFADTATKRYGTTVLEQIRAHRDVDSISNGTKTVIPYDSVIKAEVTKSTAEYTKPTDDFCVEG